MYTMNAPTFLNKKKSRPSKSAKGKDKEIHEEMLQNVTEPLIYEPEKIESEPLYCFCNSISYGAMIKCDYNHVRIFNYI
jgi:hypothetical protein